jgi:hypothetical protein
MAVLTASWAPGHLYCCCAAQAATAEMVQVCAVEPVSESSCCAAERASAPATPLTSGCGSPCDDSRSEEGCGCLHAPVDAPLPVAITLPGHGKHGLGDLDLLLELPATLGTTLSVAEAGRCCRGSPHGPPADTLLRQGCLLLI